MLFSPIFLSFLWASSSFVSALPSEPPAEALAKLQGRAQCNANDCLRALQNRPSEATPYCESYILQSAGTVTITSYVSATETPQTPTTTLYIGTTTTTVGELTAKTNTVTQFIKRTATTTPLTAALVTACTPSPSAPVTYRISSACSCLLSSSATSTTTVTVTTTLPVPQPITQTTSYASTVLTSAYTATTTISAIQQVPVSCAALSALGPSYSDPVSGKSYTLDCNTSLSQIGVFANQFYITFEACIQACYSHSGCVAISFYRPSSSPTTICLFLKTLVANNSGGYGTVNSDYDAAWISL